MKRNVLPLISLRATITIDIDAGDFLGAAEHQRKVEMFADSLRDQYPHAILTIKERRSGTAREKAIIKQFHPRSGKMSAYE